jgi:hypothetical protein
LPFAFAIKGLKNLLVYIFSHILSSMIKNYLVKFIP